MKKHIIALVPRRGDPLAPACVVGVGPVARALCKRLLDDDDETLALLDGVRIADPLAVIVHGPEARLPWVDGALYLGEAAPGLFIPTQLELNAPAPLVQDALAREAPVALFHDMRVSLRAALPLSRDLLRLVASASAA